MVTMRATLKKAAAGFSLSIVGLAALSFLATPLESGASTKIAADGLGATAQICPTGTTQVAGRVGVPANLVNENGDTAKKNAGTAYSDVQCYNAAGELVAYGNADILYELPSSALIPLGQQLYMQDCASCHGVHADGVLPNGTTGNYPDLTGLGPATINFWVTTGRMPAANPRDVQAMRRQPRLTVFQSNAIAAWVNSLQPATPYIPSANLNGANLTVGQDLFALNCAACHTITGGGDALASSTFAPSLHVATPTQIVDAIRTGPGNMPRFTGNLTDSQVRDITAYVAESIQKPTNIGGVGMGGLGPVAEGFIGLALGVGGLMLVSFWVGDRSE